MKKKLSLYGYLIFLFILAMTSLGFWFWFKSFDTPSLSAPAPSKMGQLYSIVCPSLTAILISNEYFSKTNKDKWIKIILTVLFYFSSWIFMTNNMFTRNTVISERILSFELLITLVYFLMASLLISIKPMSWSIQWILILTLMCAFFFFSQLIYLNDMITQKIFYRQLGSQFEIAMASAFAFAYGYQHSKKHNVILFGSILAMLALMLFILYLKANLDSDAFWTFGTYVLWPLLNAQFGGMILKSIIKSQSS